MKCKRRTDNRSLDKKAQEVLRIRVVRRVREGSSPEELAKVFDIDLRTIYRWIERCHYGGEGALRNKPKPGRPPKLTQPSGHGSPERFCDTTPQQLSFPFGAH
ncbi:MAG: hypothetical protein Kow0092_22680 [Deferrisomatales bacterium]